MLTASDLIASTSLYFSETELEAPRLTPPRRWKLGMIITMLVPMSDISSRMLLLEPSPMASMAITDATPMMIPSIVSKALSLFLTSARMAILNKLE
jgi:hypothetical protein